MPVELGEPLPHWVPPPRPTRAALTGRYCRLEPLDVDRHARELHAAYEDPAGWTYLSYGPFPDEASFREWLAGNCLGDDPMFFVVVVDGWALGMAAYLRTTPAAGTIEVGHIHYAPALQRSRAATEAMYLMMRHAFDLGYRRYEWKCDALNAASRRAATRLGFVYEGTFRNHLVYKGRNRDTAWYAVVDSDWPRLREAFEEWLDPANFGEDGRQRTRLTRRAQIPATPPEGTGP